MTRIVSPRDASLLACLALLSIHELNSPLSEGLIDMIEDSDMKKIGIHLTEGTGKKLRIVQNLNAWAKKQL